MWRKALRAYMAYGEWVRRLPLQRSRRAWVVALYLGLAVNAGNIVAIGFESQQSLVLTFAVWLISMLAVVVWIRLSCWAMPVIANPPVLPSTVPVDERQQALRDRAYRRAYHSTLSLFVLAALAAYILQEDLPAILRRVAELNLMPAILGNTAIVLLFMPVAFLAWTEPDDVTEKAASEFSLKD